LLIHRSECESLRGAFCRSNLTFFKGLLR
jgi:hypothetical protein